MNSPSIETHSPAAPFPEIAALNDLNTPPEAEQDGNIFEASLRAISHHRRTSNTMPQLKLVEFSVELPTARTVQLAADFTDWEETPLDMIRFNGGVWSMTVPLPPGIYAYRFRVDGEWYDDPRAMRRDAGAPGRSKAFVKVG